MKEMFKQPAFYIILVIVIVISIFIGMQIEKARSNKNLCDIFSALKTRLVSLGATANDTKNIDERIQKYCK